MTNEEILAVWSPEDSPWATWVKPVLFAHLNVSPGCAPNLPNQRDVTWAPAAAQKAGIVLDLPGDEGIWVGVALAARGYRPVPLYNALPLPSNSVVGDSLSRRSIVAVDVLPIIAALRHNARQLATLTVPPSAPPVFLLDANRQGDGDLLQPEAFDNRSICFTTDFPSANFLQTQGIQRILLGQRARSEPQTDLQHVLCRWQEGGLTLERMRVDEPAASEKFRVNPPSWYGLMFQRALASIGLRRAAGGGFGAWMPESSAGG
jgi:hypothetical protein